MNEKKTDIVLTYGDGIGPEIMKAVITILEKAHAPLNYHEITVGEKAYLAGHKNGITPEAWDLLHKYPLFLKAPVTTPQGGGFRSLNVTIRAALGLYANVRPATTYNPFITTKYPGMDIVIVRENEEDLYTGIEYQVSHDTMHAIKIITKKASRKIIHHAFQYAQANHRKKVTCFTKDNILKISDGCFSKLFFEIAQEYPDIQNEHWIIDIGAAKLTDKPDTFDVIVTPNLYGDILSDITAQIAGSVGIAPSANIGTYGAMFEAIHGSAPRRAEKDLANPSALLLAAVMLLSHIGEDTIANTIHNAWLKTIEDGIHTYDIANSTHTKKQVGTKAFGEAVIERLGQKPEQLHSVTHTSPQQSTIKQLEPRASKELIGVDIFITDRDGLDTCIEKIEKTVTSTHFSLFEIGNRGSIIWPKKHPNTSLSDVFRIRCMQEQPIEQKELFHLLQAFDTAGYTIVSYQPLFTYDGVPGFNKSA